MGAVRYNLTINPPGDTVTIFNTNYQFTNLNPGTNYSIVAQAISSDDVPLGPLASAQSTPLLVITGKDVREKYRKFSEVQSASSVFSSHLERLSLILQMQDSLTL